MPRRSGLNSTQARSHMMSLSVRLTVLASHRYPLTPYYLQSISIEHTTLQPSTPKAQIVAPVRSTLLHVIIVDVYTQNIVPL